MASLVTARRDVHIAGVTDEEICKGGLVCEESRRHTRAGQTRIHSPVQVRAGFYDRTVAEVQATMIDRYGSVRPGPTSTGNQVCGPPSLRGPWCESWRAAMPGSVPAPVVRVGPPIYCTGAARTVSLPALPSASPIVSIQLVLASTLVCYSSSIVLRALRITVFLNHMPGTS
jgi:hypothetical protein